MGLFDTHFVKVDHVSAVSGLKMLVLSNGYRQVVKSVPYLDPSPYCLALSDTVKIIRILLSKRNISMVFFNQIVFVMSSLHMQHSRSMKVMVCY